ncbi:hypothetical protein ACFFSY_30485 [Paenibacillus aurantiacus]|uniref:Uncharacterized protein n=1 Tax=Paenibacillus aurantiacus TaxID=1936118 RepID=A0ABV5KYI3_9BACL
MRFKRSYWILLMVLLLTECEPSRNEVLAKLVSHEEGRLRMHIFSASQEWDLAVNRVLNASPVLLARIQLVEIHAEKDEIAWLKAIGLEEQLPVVLVFDTEQLVFQTNNPEELEAFADTLVE